MEAASMYCRVTDNKSIFDLGAREEAFKNLDSLAQILALFSCQLLRASERGHRNVGGRVATRGNMLMGDVGI